jgi:hypothetical protein
MYLFWLVAPFYKFFHLPFRDAVASILFCVSREFVMEVTEEITKCKIFLLYLTVNKQSLLTQINKLQTNMKSHKELIFPYLSMLILVMPVAFRNVTYPNDLGTPD